MNKAQSITLAFAAALVLLSSSARAQWNTATQPSDRPVAVPRYDPAAQAKWMSDYMQKSMDASDDEWKVIWPRIQEAQTAQFELRGFVIPTADPVRPPATAPADPSKPVVWPKWEANELGKATDDLKALLADKNAPVDQIKAKVQAVRTAREKIQAKAKKAQAALREILNVRQEASLILSGTLD